jgi:signal transduction histidine kinase
MLNELGRWLVDPSGLTPHGFCLSWEPGLIWLHAVSDGAIGVAYFTIPLALAIFVHRRQDIAFKPVFLLFAAFILLCGFGHLLDLLTLWVPAYGLEGLVKAATACVSVVTAIALWMLLPQLMLLPSPIQLREVRQALSEREQRARELSRLNTELEQFAYIASHDLKAPLRAIGQLAEWIEEDVHGIAGPEALENLRLMQQRIGRMDMLIASLLNYSRAGHDKAAAESVHIGDLVDEIVASIAPPAGFRVRFQGEALTIFSQRPPLDHVLRNLISNAIKHHDRPEGEVVVSVQIIDGAAEFRVEDDGPGIAPAFHERIFMIFQTLKSRDEHETSGVGLSIVQKIVERAGGKVWVESAPPRRGTTFLFTWPQAILGKVPAKGSQSPHDSLPDSNTKSR